MRTRRSQSSSDPVSRGHRSVLLQEILDSLSIQSDDIVVDATLGGAGHAKELVAKLGSGGTFIGFDLDTDAIERAKDALKDALATVVLIEANFRDLQREAQQRGITTITKALFDLGWSSYQLDSGRGFSFLADEPLAMTYSSRGGAVTAATIVNEWQERSIADILYGFAEEHYARKIARAIVERRKQKPFTTSRELAEFIKANVPSRYAYGRIHPATRTFQALRIAVNDEIGALTEGLTAARDMLAPNGRIAVITFHSVEDRIVKRAFAEWEKNGTGVRVNKKPLVPTAEEERTNPRSRSAKLRIFEKHISYDKETLENKQI